MQIDLADVNRAFGYFGEFVVACTVLCHSLRGVVVVLEKVAEWTAWKFDDNIAHGALRVVGFLCSSLENISKVAGVGSVMRPRMKL